MPCFKYFAKMFKLPVIFKMNLFTILIKKSVLLICFCMTHNAFTLNLKKLKTLNVHINCRYVTHGNTVHLLASLANVRL